MAVGNPAGRHERDEMEIEQRRVTLIWPSDLRSERHNIRRLGLDKDSCRCLGSSEATKSFPRACWSASGRRLGRRASFPGRLPCSGRRLLAWGKCYGRTLPVIRYAFHRDCLSPLATRAARVARRDHSRPKYSGRFGPNSFPFQRGSPSRRRIAAQLLALTLVRIFRPSPSEIHMSGKDTCRNCR